MNSKTLSFNSKPGVCHIQGWNVLVRHSPLRSSTGLPSVSWSLFSQSMLQLSLRSAAVWSPAVLMEVRERMSPLYHVALVFQLVLSMMYQEKALEITPATSAA